MRTFKLFISCFFCFFLLLCCDKNDCKPEQEFQLSSVYMKQTIWKGRIWYESKGEIVNEGYINIQFSTEKRGTYEFKYNDDKDQTVEDFQYEISDKLLVFTADEIGRYPRLRGDWLIKSYNESKIVMVKDGYAGDGVSENMELNLFNL